MSIITRLFSRSKTRKYSNAEKVEICRIATQHSPDYLFRVYNDNRDPSGQELKEFELNIAKWQAQIYANAKQAFDNPARNYLAKGLAFVIGFAGGVCGGIYAGALAYWALIGIGAGVGFGLSTTPVGWLILGGVGIGIAGGILGVLTNSAVKNVVVKVKAHKVQKQTQEAEKSLSDQGTAEPRLSYSSMLNNMAQSDAEKQALIGKIKQQEGQIALLQSDFGTQLSQTVAEKVPELLTRFVNTPQGTAIARQGIAAAAIRQISSLDNPDRVIDRPPAQYQA